MASQRRAGARGRDRLRVTVPSMGRGGQGQAGGWWRPAAAPDRALPCLVPAADQPGFVRSAGRNRVHGRAESPFSLVLSGNFGVVV